MERQFENTDPENIFNFCPDCERRSKEGLPYPICVLNIVKLPVSVDSSYFVLWFLSWTKTLGPIYLDFLILITFVCLIFRFGVSRNGRCLIADDMGLGKTVQALGIAHFYVESWPLLIVCPSSMRFPWEEAVLRFLPTVNPFSVVVLTAGSDDFYEANVVISSYDLLRTCLEDFKRKKFGVIIFVST